jgi:hypothetical protein
MHKATDHLVCKRPNAPLRSLVHHTSFDLYREIEYLEL